MVPNRPDKFSDDDKIYLESILMDGYKDIVDIYVSFIAELGTVEYTIGEFMGLDIGSVIDLGKPAGESIELSVNRSIFGRGEVMVYEKNLAIRINEILDSRSVIQNLKNEF